MKTSIIVTTYNQPHHLKRVLTALSHQTRHDFEVVIADDGSTKETSQLIEELRHSHLPFPLKHHWQPDEGFRVGEARNGAIHLSEGEWLIFLDGDMVVHPQFVEAHLRQAAPNRLLFGARVKMNQDFSAPEAHYSPVTESLGEALGGWLVQKFARKPRLFWDLMFNALSYMIPRRLFFKLCFKSGSNFSTSRKLIERVNGFDQTYNNLSGEDGDLFWRLLHAGAEPRSILFSAISQHLWHPDNWQRSGRQRDEVLKMVSRTITQRKITCPNGLISHGQY